MSWVHTSMVYNESLLRGHATLSSLHQVQGGKERRRKEEERQGEGGATQCSADCEQSASRNNLRLKGEICYNP